MINLTHAFFSFGWLKGLDFLPPLLFRIFLAPIFWIEGSRRLGLFSGDNIIWWNPATWIDGATYQQHAEVLGNAHGLFTIPSPGIMNGVLGGIEIVAAVLLILGFAVRWISIPLMATVLLMGLAATEFGSSMVETGKELFMTHGYKTPANTGITSAMTLFLMVLGLFFMGAGRFFSVDWLIHYRYVKKISNRGTDSFAGSEDIRDPFDVDKTE